MIMALFYQCKSVQKHFVCIDGWTDSIENEHAWKRNWSWYVVCFAVYSAYYFMHATNTHKKCRCQWMRSSSMLLSDKHIRTLTDKYCNCNAQRLMLCRNLFRGNDLKNIFILCFNEFQLHLIAAFKWFQFSILRKRVLEHQHFIDWL